MLVVLMLLVMLFLKASNVTGDFFEVLFRILELG